MKKKFLVTILSICMVFFVALGTACKSEPPYTVEGFTVRETLEVNYGASVDLETPLVIDSAGNLLDCWTLVTDVKGNYVPVNAGQFSADDVGGYTITYTVRATDNTTYEKKTIVKVNANGGEQTNTIIDVDYEQFIVVGDEVTINAVCSNEQAELSYTVTKKDGTAVTVNDNTFVADSVGTYMIKVAEVGGSAQCTYKIFAENEAKLGEVESFDNAWEEKQEFINGKRQSWEVVTSEDCGLLDPFGQKASFAKYTSDKSYPRLYIDIRQDREYYAELASQGYDYVSMWIYMDSEKPHDTMSDRDPNAGFYRKSGPDLYPGEWIEFKLSLVDTRVSWDRSFVTCYNLYNNENLHYLQIDNSNEWNTWGGGDTMTFYIADIYANKPATITAVENVETSKKVGNTVDLSTYVEADCELSYAVTYRGETQPIEGSSYTFLSNGEYEIIVAPKTYNLSGSLKILFTVTDDNVLTGTPLIKERTAETLSVDVTELNLAFEEVSGVKPAIVETKIYRNENEVALTDNVFVADTDGLYTVEVKGEYTIGETDYVTYGTYSIDVYSQATKYSVIDTGNVLYTSVYASWDAQASGETGEFTVDGKTAIVKAQGNNQSVSVYAKPFFSKYYYEQLLLEESNSQVVMDLYVEINSTSEDVKRYYGLFGSYTANTTIPVNIWQQLSIGLQDFIDDYDTLVNTYVNYKSLIEEGFRPEQGNSNLSGAWYATYGPKTQRTIYMNFYIVSEAEVGEASLATGKQLLLDTDNDLNEILTVTLDGNAATIQSVEVFFNETWYVLEDNIFNPAWDGEYTFRINAVGNGIKVFKVFETTIATSGEAFETTIDESLHRIYGENNFEIGELLSQNYDYEIEVYRVVGNLLYSVDGVLDGTTLLGANLEVGAYKIDVYAVKGESVWGKILYHTLTVDYDESEDSYVYFNDGNENLNDYVIHRANWGTTNGYTLVWGTLENYEGNFISLNQGNEGKNTWEAQIVPIHSKAYYEALNESGLEYAFKFDFITNPNGNTTDQRYVVDPFKADGSSTRSYHNDATLYTREFSIQDILDNWDMISNANDIKENYQYKHMLFVKSISGSTVFYPYIGNFRLEPDISWNKELSMDTYGTDWQCYQWSTSEIGSSEIQLTTVDTTRFDAKEGTFITSTANKAAISITLNGKYSKEYYEALLKQGNYKLVYEVCLFDRVEGTAGTSVTKSFYYNSSYEVQGVNGTYTMTPYYWYTVEIDLNCLVANYDTPRIFYTNMEGYNLYLGNIRVEEGEITDSIIPMKYTNTGVPIKATTEA